MPHLDNNRLWRGNTEFSSRRNRRAPREDTKRDCIVISQAQTLWSPLRFCLCYPRYRFSLGNRFIRSPRAIPRAKTRLAFCGGGVRVSFRCRGGDIWRIRYATQLLVPLPVGLPFLCCHLFAFPVCRQLHSRQHWCHTCPGEGPLRGVSDERAFFRATECVDLTWDCITTLVQLCHSVDDADVCLGLLPIA